MTSTKAIKGIKAVTGEMRKIPVMAAQRRKIETSDSEAEQILGSFTPMGEEIGLSDSNP